MPLITASSGHTFCRVVMQGGAGTNTAGAERLFATDNRAVDAWCCERASVAEAAARDSEAATPAEYAARVKDPWAGRTTEGPTPELSSMRNQEKYHYTIVPAPKGIEPILKYNQTPGAHGGCAGGMEAGRRVGDKARG